MGLSGQVDAMVCHHGHIQTAFKDHDQMLLGRTTQVELDSDMGLGTRHQTRRRLMPQRPDS